MGHPLHCGRFQLCLQKVPGVGFVKLTFRRGRFIIEIRAEVAQLLLSLPSLLDLSDLLACESIAFLHQGNYFCAGP